MLNFFRKIRKKLAADGKFARYTRYAIGEVLLIMLGIFMALQLQNWNENRKQELQFKSTLEQLYTTIKYDAEAFYRHSIKFVRDTSRIDQLLNHQDSISDYWLPYILYDLTYSGSQYSSESDYYAKDLNYDSNNSERKELTKEILNYINNIGNYNYRKDDDLLLMLKEINIAHPNIGTADGRWTPDSDHYTESDRSNLKELIRTDKFNALAKNLMAFKKLNYYRALNLHNDGLSIRELIKDYYPDVKVLYKDVGIIGTSIDGFDDVGAKSTPMNLVDEDKSIWEIELHLKEGRVKFRCRDSWAQNWGVRGNEAFPKGPAVQDGLDITIPEAGNYRILLNLTENTYEFIKLED